MVTTACERDLARLVQHEIDHLQGKLFSDRMLPGASRSPWSSTGRSGLGVRPVGPARGLTAPSTTATSGRSVSPPRRIGVRSDGERAMLSGMPNLAHPLFSAPAGAVDADMVRSFLALGLEESFTVEYKRNIEAAPDTVAAMANTHGGVVLIGVDAHTKDKNLPGELIGVKPMDKDRLVSKMATTLDPPWWTPEVIPVIVDEKLLLVVRVDPDSAPTPLLHQGAVRIRLDGRNEIADRRLVQLLFQQATDAPTRSYSSDPRFDPDTHATPATRPAYRKETPTLVVRAAASLPLRAVVGRPRLHGPTVDALMRALSALDAEAGDAPHVAERLRALSQRVNPQSPAGPWRIDPEHGHAWFVRLGAGHAVPDVSSLRPPPLMRMECTSSVAQGGATLEVLFDLLFWTQGQRVAGDLWPQACYEAVRALVCDALPTLGENLLGTSAVPTPPIELHIAAGEAHGVLTPVLNTEFLGPQTGNGELRRGSDFLDEDLVATGDLPKAVTEALRNIALDWRYLQPHLPVLT